MDRHDDLVERVAKAICDAEDSQSGDHVGTVIYASEHLFYEVAPGETEAEACRRATMGVCRDAARAAITEAISAVEPILHAARCREPSRVIDLAIEHVRALLPHREEQ